MVLLKRWFFKSWFFKKINKISKPLVRLTKKKEGRTKLTTTKMKEGMLLPILQK